jgi:hypothetical protein
LRRPNTTRVAIHADTLPSERSGNNTPNEDADEDADRDPEFAIAEAVGPVGEEELREAHRHGWGQRGGAAAYHR